jgi:site-specific recombinase XerD
MQTTRMFIAQANFIPETSFYPSLFESTSSSYSRSIFSINTVDHQRRYRMLEEFTSTHVTRNASSIPTDRQTYTIQNYEKRFVNDLRQVFRFLLQLSPPNKKTVMI